ncbi:MAG: glycosyltransferase family 9 protein [Candidatus Cyclobacteriaceae bacterium M3_2C_046]
MKILILRFSSIGDIVLTTPVPRAVKMQITDAEVHYCTKIQYRDMLTANPYIDQVICLENSLNHLVKILKKEKYDSVIDLHHNLRTFLIKRKLGVKAFSFHKINWQKWLMVNLKVNKLPNVHIVDRYMDTLKPLNLKKDSLGLDYYIPEKDVVETGWLPATHRNGYIAFVIGAKFGTKKLPYKKMVQLCHQINRPVILLGGKEDAELGQQIFEFFDDNEKELTQTIIFNACGKFNLNQSASIIKQAKYVFTHDTGLMHIAAAFKKEIFSIWGNTIPEFGMYPYRTKFTIFENKKISCRPCSKIGFQECPKGHFKCMNDLQFDFYLPWKPDTSDT